MSYSGIKANIKVHIDLVALLEWIVAAFFILELNTVFVNATSINLFIPELGCLFSGILAVLVTRQVKKNTIYCVFMYEIYAIIFLFLSVAEASKMNYIVKFLLFIPMLILLYDGNSSIAIDIIKKASRLTVCLALASVVMYTSSFFFQPFGSLNIYWGSEQNVGNYIFFYETQYQEIVGQHFLRNTGIFCEAPMYAFALIMALSTQLFFYKTTNKRNVIILLITCFSTLSVTAVFMCFLLLGLKYYLDGGKKHFGTGKDSNYAIRLLAVPIVVLIIALVAYGLYSFKSTTGLSLIKRLDDYYAAYRAWLSRPIWGIGYGNGEPIKQYMLSWRIRYGAGFSNAILQILATMGIYGTVLYILSVGAPMSCR